MLSSSSCPPLPSKPSWKHTTDSCISSNGRPQRYNSSSGSRYSLWRMVSWKLSGWKPKNLLFNAVIPPRTYLYLLFHFMLKMPVALLKVASDSGRSFEVILCAMTISDSKGTGRKAQSNPIAASWVLYNLSVTFQQIPCSNLFHNRLERSETQATYNQKFSTGITA